MEQNTPVCQSCGMPMVKPEDFGSPEYCIHCYRDGAFTMPNLTLEAMIERLVPFAREMGLTEEQARKMAHERLPQLKRWK